MIQRATRKRSKQDRIYGPTWIRTHAKRIGTGRYSITHLKGVGSVGTEEYPSDGSPVDLNDPYLQKDYKWQYDPGLSDGLDEHFRDPTETATFKWVMHLPAGDSVKKSFTTEYIGIPMDGDEDDDPDSVIHSFHPRSEDWAVDFWNQLGL